MKIFDSTKGKDMKVFIAALTALILASCSGEEWSCVEEGKSLYSISSSGKPGSAGKGCSCEEIREFELRNFGSVDEGALKSDFGC